MDAPFAFHLPTQVRFGDGVSQEVGAVLPPHTRHVAVLRGVSDSTSAPLIARLEGVGVSVHQVICGGEPSVTSVNAAVAALSGPPIDAVIACGGGSVIDSGKAVAFCLSHTLRLTEDFGEVPAVLLAKPCPLPLIAIPTTAGTGSEVTANAVLDIPSEQAKVSLRGRGMQARHALVDPLLLPSAPKGTVLSSGLDAVVQTIEAYTSNAATPFSDALTAPNVQRGVRALKMVLETGDPAAWRDLAWVSLTSGVALANAGLGAAHGAASVLGGRYGAPHGALCGRLLIPVLRQNLRRSVPGSEIQGRLKTCIEAIATVFPPPQGSDALAGLWDWQEAQGLPRLSEMGVTEAAIPDLAARSAQASSSKKNAVALSVADYEDILRAAL